jgi:tol-pal system protein YbgF
MANLKRLLAAAVISSFTFVVYADDAPVYEVDNYPPPFDSQSSEASSPVEAPTAGAYSGGLTAEVSGAPPTQAAQRETYAAPPPVPIPPPRQLTFEQRIQRAEQQIKNLQQSSTLAKAEELQKEVQSLRGQVEEMTHQLQQAQSQQKAMYTDLDKRLAGLQLPKVPMVTPSADEVTMNAAVGKSVSKASTKRSTTSIAGAAVSPTKVVNQVAQPNVAEEQQIYQVAYDLIKAKRYNDAIATLQKMLQKYPSGPTAANAHYWLGELYGLLNKNEQSASEFSLVVKKYPSSSKASDAQLKLGLIYAGQFKWPDAKAAFKGVVGRYPGTASARLATEQLKQIKKSGH